MRPFVLVAVALLVPATAWGQRTNPALAVEAIPPLLRLSNPPAIVRAYEQTFDIDGPGRATETVRRVVTVFNLAGQDAAKDVVYYDGIHRLDEARAVLYDHAGKVVRERRGRDFVDTAISDGFSLYTDNRVRVVDVQDGRYPYTVEITYRIKHHGLIAWPTWIVQPEGLPTEQSRFQVSAPLGMPVRIRPQGNTPDPTVATVTGKRVYTWEAAMRPAFTPEPSGPTWLRQADLVDLAPEAFEIGGVRGSMATWEDFGRFYGQLGTGRRVLPDAAKADVAQTITGAENDREKVERLYRYMQARTRYVSVQLGLGGWQPFDAQYVHQRSYGDCKALVNYLQALLAEANIPSFPALVRAGAAASPIHTDFPKNTFNHVILAVPLARDTVWLEATSQTAPFNHLGSFTKDRDVLLVTPEGGRLARTPASRAADNLQRRTGTLTLTADGTLAGDLALAYTGNQRDRVRNALADASPQRRTEWLHDQFDGTSALLDQIVFPDFTAASDTLRLGMRAGLRRYASITRRRLFVPLAMERWGFVPDAMTTERTQPVVVATYPFEDRDSLAITLPEGYRVEAAAPPVALDTPFGSYRLEATVDGTALRITRRLVLSKTRLDASDFTSYRTFLERVAAADRTRLVLVRE